MISFKPDSAEARAWVRFMAVSLEHYSSPASFADKALEEYRKRLIYDSEFSRYKEQGLTKDQRAILKSASKVHRVRFRPARRKAMDKLVEIGFLKCSLNEESGWYEITPSGRGAIE